MSDKISPCLPPCHGGGYTLIETLIALLILTTALLGFTALSLQAAQATRASIEADLATLQANTLAERIHANPEAVAGGDYLIATPGSAGKLCTSSFCSPAEMARFDLWEWNQGNTMLLPSASAEVTAEGDLYQITIHWSSGGDSHSHQLLFAP